MRTRQKILSMLEFWVKHNTIILILMTKKKIIQSSQSRKQDKTNEQDSKQRYFIAVAYLSIEEYYKNNRLGFVNTMQL